MKRRVSASVDSETHEQVDRVVEALPGVTRCSLVEDALVEHLREALGGGGAIRWLEARLAQSVAGIRAVQADLEGAGAMTGPPDEAAP